MGSVVDQWSVRRMVRKFDENEFDNRCKAHIILSVGEDRIAVRFDFQV